MKRVGNFQLFFCFEARGLNEYYFVLAANIW